MKTLVAFAWNASKTVMFVKTIILVYSVQAFLGTLIIFVPAKKGILIQMDNAKVFIICDSSLLKPVQ